MSSPCPACRDFNASHRRPGCTPRPPTSTPWRRATGGRPKAAARWALRAAPAGTRPGADGARPSGRPGSVEPHRRGVVRDGRVHCRGSPVPSMVFPVRCGAGFLLTARWIVRVRTSGHHHRDDGTHGDGATRRAARGWTEPSGRSRAGAQGTTNTDANPHRRRRQRIRRRQPPDYRRRNPPPSHTTTADAPAAPVPVRTQERQPGVPRGATPVAHPPPTPEQLHA
jgi:hypothetical protein